MKLTASLIAGAVRAEASATYARKLLKTASPGAVICTASGAMFRVTGKATTASGTRLRLARGGREQFVGLSQLAALRPISPKIRRFAALIHRVTAYDKSLSSYVDAAIDQAGLPRDPAMNWGRWLTATYGPVLRRYTQDTSLIDDAIREVVIHQLYELRLLDKDSPFAHFDEDHPSLAGKSLEKKVSAFLSFIFKKLVSEAVDFVRKALGIGAHGEVGRAPALSLYRNDDEGSEGSTYDDAELLADAVLGGVDTEDGRLDEDEIHQFLQAFKSWCAEHQRPNTSKVLSFISDHVEAGDTRSEIRDALVASGLRGRDGQLYTNDTFKVLMANWGRLVKRFAASDENPMGDTSVAQAISQFVPAKKRGTTSASLRLAMDDTGVIPQAPYSNNTPGAVTIIDQKPAPANPNVQQQSNSLRSKGQQPSSQDVPPQVSQQDQGEDDVQQPTQKKTIPPEIPGVNHV